MARSRARSGVAGIELAIGAPFLVLLVIGTIDVSQAILAARRLEIAAGSIAEMATTMAAQTATMNTLTSMQAWQATTAAFAFFPDWGHATGNGSFSITLSGVGFVAAKGGYSPKVAWSVANARGQPKLRPCGASGVVADTITPNTGSVSAGDVGVTSLLVADVSFTFKPYFVDFLTGPFSMQQSASVSPRIGNGVQLKNNGGPALIAVCP